MSTGKLWEKPHLRVFVIVNRDFTYVVTPKGEFVTMRQAFVRDDCIYLSGEEANVVRRQMDTKPRQYHVLKIQVGFDVIGNHTR